jgi:hypothetical protein
MNIFIAVFSEVTWEISFIVPSNFVSPSLVLCWSLNITSACVFVQDDSWSDKNKVNPPETAAPVTSYYFSQ